jgi:hypothetical protein
MFRLISLTFSLAFIHHLAQCQISAHKVLNDKVKEGIYLTVQEFNSNKPAVLLRELSRASLDLLIPSDSDYAKTKINELQLKCLKDFTYTDSKGNGQTLPAKKVWGIVIDQNLYIRPEIIHLLTDDQCFYKVVLFGAIGKFFTRQDKEGGYARTSTVNGTMTMHYAPRIIIKEYAVDFKSGAIYNLTADMYDIKKIIKTDPAFAKAKINRNNLDEFIILYNKQHPHPYANNNAQETIQID